MDVIELARVSAEIERLAAFFKAIGLHESLYKPQLIECEAAAVNKILANNRQMVMEFNRNGSEVMSQRWECSRRTAFRIRDRAAKECQPTEAA